MTVENSRILQIAWNTGPNLAAVASNMDLACDMIVADDLLPEAERLISPEARMELAIALKSEGNTHWSTIGRVLNELDERLPDPPEDDGGA